MKEALESWWPIVSRYGGMLGLGWSMFIDQGQHPQYLPLFAGLMMLDRVIKPKDNEK